MTKSSRLPKEGPRVGPSNKKRKESSLDDEADVVEEVETKAKRVRTGCRTCRSRHLKCGEEHPICAHCLKSNKDCSWEFVLKWHNNKDKSLIVGNVPALSVDGLEITFQDMSRETADYYVDGDKAYPPLPTPPQEHAPPATRPTPTHNSCSHPQPHHASSRSSQLLAPHSGTTGSRYASESRRVSHSHNGSDYAYMTGPSTGYSMYSAPDYVSSDSSLVIGNYKEALLMQVYVEEVGLWMDSLNPVKHFSQMLPHEAMYEPMLYNALLACGAKHLSLVNAEYTEEEALPYYEKATSLLLRALQNEDRDPVRCATTAVCLNVYEIMSERAMQRMNHIAGARALVKECRWNAKSTGIGAACFWLNVGMEILSCLHFNWQVAWNPDTWGIDMNMRPEMELGKEEFWCHRMLYIIAKISNFRATIPRFAEASHHDEQMRLEGRFGEWQHLMNLCETWHNNKPRTMCEMIRVAPGPHNRSPFAEIWLTGRAAPVAMLFYHTAMCLLAQVNPVMSKDTPDMNAMMMRHAHDICSIVCHSSDRGIASVAIRSLAIAAECLTVRREQEEILEKFDDIKRLTGWRIAFINEELKQKWGWLEGDQQQISPFYSVISQAPTSNLPPPPPPPPVTRPHVPSGILNPLLRTADFSLPDHPYPQHYQPPRQHHEYPQQY